MHILVAMLCIDAATFSRPGTLYQDLGSAHFDNKTKPRQIKRLIAKLTSLGYTIANPQMAA